MCASSAHKDFTRYRHRWEMPMIWLSFTLTLIGFLLAVAVVAGDSGQLTGTLGNDGAETATDFADLLIFLPLAPLAFYIYRFFMAATVRSQSILVGPKQFPGLFATYQDIGQRLEMPNLPKLYVVNGNGVVNAFALECNRRYNYVVINAEIAMLLEKSPDIVEFVLAHELAHHKLRHVSLWRLVIGVIPSMLAIVGTTTTRAQEYSADRVALAVCPQTSAAVRLLAVGPWIEQGVNPDAWLDQCDAEHREWWVRVTNALSSHAVMVKRFKALRDIEREGFSAQGEMF